MQYSRDNPSVEYKRLVALYDELHRTNGTQGEKVVYPGKSLYPFVGYIKALINRYDAMTILDYGAGKGLQYSHVRPKISKGRIYKSIKQYWGVDISCYDAGNPEFFNFPDGKFDGVISTDVLEHCPKTDLPWIIEEMFAKANKFVFANIACYPANTILSNGENAHATIEMPDWWSNLIQSVAEKYPHIDYYFITTVKKKEPPAVISNTIEPHNVPAVSVLPKNIVKAIWFLLKQRFGF